MPNQPHPGSRLVSVRFRPELRERIESYMQEAKRADPCFDLDRFAPFLRWLIEKALEKDVLGVKSPVTSPGTVTQEQAREFLVQHPEFKRCRWYAGALEDLS
jgi:hypothetical protein